MASRNVQVDRREVQGVDYLTLTLRITRNMTPRQIVKYLRRTRMLLKKNQFCMRRLVNPPASSDQRRRYCCRRHHPGVCGPELRMWRIPRLVRVGLG